MNNSKTRYSLLV